MFLKLFFFLYFIIIINFVLVFAIDEQLLDYAYISNTDTIVFDSELGGETAKVYIKYDKIYLITGSDNKIYHCWQIKGTGLTYKMGKVYFGYTGSDGNYYATYICNDGKWRGVAKLEAGGRIQFDGEYFSGPILNWIYDEKNGKYRHSSDGFDSGTGYGFSDGIGLWIWNAVSIKNNNPRKVIFNYIDTRLSKVILEGGIKADGNSLALMTGIFYDNVYGKKINKLAFSYVSFTGCNNSLSVFCINGKSGLLFSSNKKEYLSGVFINSGEYFLTGVVSILPYSGSYSVYFGWQGSGLVLTNYTYFNLPFDITFKLLDGDGDGKILIGYIESGDIQIDNIQSGVNNINIIADGKYIGTGVYNITLGNILYKTGEFSFKIYPSSEYIDNILKVFYNIKGKYDFWYRSELYTGIEFDVNTNQEYIYPDKKVVALSTEGNCFSIYADGKSVCWLKVYLKNRKGYPIPLLRIGTVDIEDAYKDNSYVAKYQTFDIDEISSSYQNGLYLSGYDRETNNFGFIKIGLVSYKPVYNGKLLYKFFDLTGDETDVYNWYQNQFSGYKKGIFWGKAVDIYFSGDRVSDGILLNDNNEVEVVYTGLVKNVQAITYNLSGTIFGSTDAVFLSGGIITGDNFESKVISIYISGTDEPDYISYYDKYYSYYVKEGIDGTKQVRLKPNIRLNGRNLVIVGQFFGLKLLGLLNKGVLSNKEKLKTIAVVGTKIPFSSYIYDIKRKIRYMTRGWSKQSYSDWKLDNIDYLDNFKAFFDCNGQLVYLGNGTDDLNIKGYNLIILKDCPVILRSNILKNSSKDKLKIISFSSKKSFIDFSSQEGRKLNSNIYIASNVDTIQADLITDGSIFTLSGDIVTSGNIFIYKRRTQGSLKRQLYIKGKIVSRNTVGGGFVDNTSKVTFPGGKKFDSGIKGLFNYDNITADILAQAYDVNFWRANIVNWGSTEYDTGVISKIILEKYGCKGDTTEDPPYCWMPIVVEYDK